MECKIHERSTKITRRFQLPVTRTCSPSRKNWIVDCTHYKLSLLPILNPSLVYKSYSFFYSYSVTYPKLENVTYLLPRKMTLSFLSVRRILFFIPKSKLALLNSLGTPLGKLLVLTILYSHDWSLFYPYIRDNDFYHFLGTVHELKANV